MKVYKFIFLDTFYSSEVYITIFLYASKFRKVHRIIFQYAFSNSEGYKFIFPDVFSNSEVYKTIFLYTSYILRTPTLGVLNKKKCIEYSYREC